MSAARILTVRDPWATLILKYGKTVENRTTNIAGDYRGPVLIHSAKQLVRAGDPAWTVADDAGMDTDRYDGEEFHLGHIIGVVDLVGVHLGSKRSEWCWHDDRGMQDRCSPWGEEDTFHLVFENPRAVDQPIPYRGALGLRHTSFEIASDWLMGPAGRAGRLVATS